VLLYELLAGRPPFDPGQLAAGGLEGMLRCIREDEPPRPSTRLSRLRAEEQTTAARQRGTEPPKLIGQLRGDLDWIAMKCLEKDRARSYETANALALDLDRYLNHQPITARPPSRGYRVGKFVRRNRAMVTAAGAVVLALSLGIIGSVWQAREAIRARNQARQAGTLAQQQRDVALNAQRTTDQALRQLEIHRASELFRQNKAAEGLAALASMLRRDPTNWESAGWLVNELTQRSFPLPVLEAIRHDDIVHDARFSLDGTRILTVCRNNRACLWDGSTGLPVTPPFEHDRTVIQAGDYLEGLHPLHADLSADGAQVATASADGTARLWEIRTGQSIVLPHGSLVSWIRFSPDGGLVATACKDGKVRLWSVADGRPRGSPLSHADWVNSVEFSPDGRWLVSASDDNTAQVWAVPSGQKSGEPMRHARWVKHASFSPDGRRIVTASQDATARVWDAATGRPSSRPLVHGHIVATAAFSPDGRWVATASFDKTARVWDVLTGEPVGRPLSHRGAVRTVSFSPEGLRLVTAAEDGTARVWDAGTGDPLTEPMRHQGVVWSARFSPDGQRVVTASADGTARVWDVRPGNALALRLRHPSGVNSAQWSRDGLMVCTSSETALLWDATTGVDRMVLNGRVGDVVSAASLSPDGRFLATVFRSQRVWLWDVTRQREVQLLPELVHPAAVRAAVFSPDSRWLATVSADRTAQVWEVATRKAAGEPLRHDGAVLGAEFSPDGQFLVTASADGVARVWHLADRSRAFAALRHEGPVVMARFSPDGNWIATASADRTARLWEARTGRPHRVLLAHLGAVNTVQFSPDNTRLVTASVDRTARVWRVEDGQPLGDPLPHDDRVEMAEFSPDGDWVLTASRDGAARVWSPTTGQLVAEPLAHEFPVNCARFSPDGRWIVTASFDRTAALRRLLRPSASPPRWLPELAEAVAGERFISPSVAEPVPAGETLRLEQSLASGQPADDYGNWAAWFFADRRRRPIAPDASLTVADLIDRQIRLGCHLPYQPPEWQAELLRYEPTNAPGLARLAQGQLRWYSTNTASTLTHLDWLSRTALRLAPDEPLAQWARALVLARQGDLPAALERMERARQAGLDDTCFVVDYTDLLVKARLWPEAYLAFQQAFIWPKPESFLDRHQRSTYRDDWAAQLARAQPSRETRVFQFVSDDIRPRRPETPARMLDLRADYAFRLANFWLETRAYLGGLADFLDPPVRLAGVDFDARGAISASQLDSRPAMGRVFPLQRHCRRLCFLQTARTPVPDGTRLGAYRLHDAEGGQVEVPILYGRNVCAFVLPADAPVGTTTVAWECPSPDGTRVRLSMLTWDNPRPGVALDRIDFVAEPLPCDPVLLAITADP